MYATKKLLLLEELLDEQELEEEELDEDELEHEDELEQHVTEALKSCLFVRIAESAPVKIEPIKSLRESRSTLPFSFITVSSDAVME